MQNEEELKQDKKITIVESDIKANYILSEIIKDKGCVIGVDCEACLEMSRFGILCLIQVIYLISLRLLIKITHIY